mgnify:FL=1
MGFADMSGAAEAVAGVGRMNLFEYILEVRTAWRDNVEVFGRVLESDDFNCLVADEAYEIEAHLHRNPALNKCPLVVIHDFIGIEATSSNPLERIGVWVTNKKWIEPRADLSLFAGSLADIPDKRLGLFLPRARQFAEDRYTFLGPVLPFDLEELPEKQELREELRREIDIGKGSLIVCSAGGTSVGLPLLRLCAAAYPYIEQGIPDARMLIVTGPRIDPKRLSGVTEGAEKDGLFVHPFVPRLYRYFAAADICIVQAGGMTTAELTALGTPFLYFPLEGHSEQENRIGPVLERNSRGERMRLRKMTPESLARKVLEHLETHPDSGGPLPAAQRRRAVPTPEGTETDRVSMNGARRAAQLIGELLDPG